MINKKVIRERLSLIQDAASVLNGLANLPETEFIADLRNPATAESSLRRGLQAVFDVGRHILASSGQTSLVTSDKVARRLRQQGVVDPKLATRLEMMAGYLNRLVQLYAQVKPHELYESVRSYIGDLRTFALAVEEWMSAQPD